MRQMGRQDETGSILETFVRRLRELTGRGDGDAGLRETLEELIEDTESLKHDQFTQEERTLLLNALSFGELRVDDVMIPRADIEAIEVNMDLGDVVKAMQRAAHTRLIVFRQNLDDVLGI
ncbi:MAG: magnesium/cobalt efflux protein, partial [Pseudomonadota bacterium]